MPDADKRRFGRRAESKTSGALGAATDDSDPDIESDRAEGLPILRTGRRRRHQNRGTANRDAGGLDMNLRTDGGEGDSSSGTFSGSLAGYWESDCWTWAWEHASPSQAVLELSGPTDADFDLYANTGEASSPSSSSYDYASYTADSQETIVIDAPDTSTDLYVTVDSYSGSGSYDLTITEYE